MLSSSLLLSHNCCCCRWLPPPLALCSQRQLAEHRFSLNLVSCSCLCLSLTLVTYFLRLIWRVCSSTSLTRLAVTLFRLLRKTARMSGSIYLTRLRSQMRSSRRISGLGQCYGCICRGLTVGALSRAVAAFTVTFSGGAAIQSCLAIWICSFVKI